MTLVHPRVHLNGTSLESLIGQYSHAYEMVQRAIHAVQQAAPHGRDYYVIDGNPTQEAIRQHVARLQKLEDVRNELEELTSALLWTRQGDKGKTAVGL